jgi:AcrR family transcriptional regulator
VCPKIADPSLRIALIETAARLVATEGQGGLTLRRLAREVGTSTMAIYTHFGGMDELRREVRREGFARLGTHLRAVPETADPVSDLGMLGVAYYVSATASPSLYRAMFLEGPLDEDDAQTGLDTFAQLVSGVTRCLEARRIRAVDAVEVATELWAVSHGLITLQFANLLPADEVRHQMAAVTRRILVGCGADPKTLDRSAARTRQRARAFALPA